MRVAGGIAGLIVSLALGAGAALAQSASDFRLPQPGPSSANPRSQGPVDADNPVVAPTRPAASASPSPAPALPLDLPVTALPSTSDPAPRSAATLVRPVARPAAPPAATASATAPAGGFQFPATAPFGPSSDAAAPGFTLPTSSPIEPVLAEPEVTGAVWWWPYLASLAGLIAAVFALLWWRSRRAEAEPVIDFERPLGAAPPAVPQPDSIPAPVSLASAIPEPALGSGFSVPAAHLPGLSIALEARRMSASLVATTFSYRLVLTNHGAEPLSALAIEGDMISAHASLPPEQQVAQPAQRLELRHALGDLAPGESAEFAGDIRLPLGAITPIRAGAAAYFVPLARFRIEAAEPEGRPVVLAQTFVVGELSETAGATLRPFRLDLGPRTYSRLGQRLVN